MIHDLIYDDGTSKVDMNRKGKTPSDIPVPPLKYIDLLDEDKPVSGQKFVCVSFISPDNILKQKNIHFLGNVTEK